MAEQSLVQARIDNQLKEEAVAIFDSLGLDVPTAIRMFFKATVRAKGLPFSTVLEENAAPAREPSESEQLMDFMRKMVMYDSPSVGDDDDTVVIMPLENGEIPAAMYVQMVTKIPVGKVGRWSDIFMALGKYYGREVSRLPERPLPRMMADGGDIPYWRIISNQGVLGNGRGGSREFQKERLEREGIPVVQRGSIEGSYKVDNYKEFLFDFSSLKAVKAE